MNAHENAGQHIVLALDGLRLPAALSVAYELGPRVGALKVHHLADELGLPVVIQSLKAEATQVRIWVDYKLNDIPETVALRAAAVKNAGANMLTVMANGGIDMMKAAVEHGPSTIIAVTVLTSLTEEEAHLTYGQPASAAVLYQARMAKLAGVHALVCSPQEVGVLSRRPELQGMILITPGVRPAGANADDQKRANTPAAAIRNGADLLVVGRPIMQAPDRLAAFMAIGNEIRSVLAERDAH